MRCRVADEAVIDAMVADYDRHGGGPLWLVDASEVKAYRAGAIGVAANRFAGLVQNRGLVRLVAVIVAPTVRMAASVVAMTMRAAGAPLDIVVVATRAEAEATINARS
jgi:hypothetical protein